MRKLTIILLLTLSLATFGQDRQKPNISVMGTARVIVKPDLGVLNINVSDVRMKMGDAIKALGEKSSYYNTLLKQLGFKEEEIKTTSFNVSVNRVYKSGESLDSGYVASQSIRVEFVYDQNTLQRIVAEFSKSENPIDFNFDFALSEQLKQKVQSQILELAVKDANEKVGVIAKSSGVKLKRIVDISYPSWGVKDQGMELIERNHRRGDYGGALEAIPNFNFTPDDLVFRDSLTVQWSIE